MKSMPLTKKSKSNANEYVEKEGNVYSSVHVNKYQPTTLETQKKILSIIDKKNKKDGIKFLSNIPDSFTRLTFFDPEYRGIMDYQRYGNEGQRQRARAALTQMPNDIIIKFIKEIDRILVPSGHLMLWVDKYHLAEGIHPWLQGLNLKIVDLVTWDKGRIGMGYRTRRKCEYMVVIQKYPLRAKGVWTAHNIPDVWLEKLAKDSKGHAHVKPMGLQAAIIAATTDKLDIVVDPAAGSYSVMNAAHSVGRRFLGCDLRG